MSGPRSDSDPDTDNRSFDQCTVRLEDQQKLLAASGCINAKSRVYVEFSDLCYTVPQCKGEPSQGTIPKSRS